MRKAAKPICNPTRRAIGTSVSCLLQWLGAMQDASLGRTLQLRLPYKLVSSDLSLTVDNLAGVMESKAVSTVAKVSIAGGVHAAVA